MELITEQLEGCVCAQSSEGSNQSVGLNYLNCCCKLNKRNYYEDAASIETRDNDFQ